ARAKSPTEMTAQWYKNDKKVVLDDRVKAVMKKDDKDKEGYQFLLEIHGPQKDDEAKYKIVIKNAEGQNQQALNLAFD
uniref:Immunoglobulin I-set domain-containing protein n=1 Tax=Plectus sambesii TaxID=2011161 RepID=A0A914WG59_9BILA